LELIVNDFPFGIDNALEVVNVLNSDFGVLFFRLKFEFDFQSHDFGILEALWLLLKTGV
jgi:hypothetical protein